jgi:hypothetical protein
VYQSSPGALLLSDGADDAPRQSEGVTMRTHIDRFVAAIRRDHRVRLVPRTGRPRRARATFVAVDRRAVAY